MDIILIFTWILFTSIYYEASENAKEVKIETTNEIHKSQKQKELKNENCNCN